MKKYVLTFSAILLCMEVFAQKLEENKKDDFTNHNIKKTSWETLYTTLTTNARFRIVQIDSLPIFELKLMFGKVFSIDKDDELLLKLDDGEIVKLKNFEYKVTCIGCGATGFQGSQAEGIDVNYPIDKDQFAILKTHKAVKVRIHTTDGYLDEDLKDKNATKIITCLNLVSN